MYSLLCPFAHQWPLIQVKPKGFKLELQLDYKATFTFEHKSFLFLTGNVMIHFAAI